ncbi:hypothetical protein Fmac_002186 [Flemingia macrophylla]|uniref:Uncharacterized protein n=1 Tax=Flemingia macrophylla TaxID=520843 RepID=A0ABD1NJC8_9FABA
MDERKRKWMESNRESVANELLAQSIKVKEEAYIEMEVANDILRAQTMELADCLHFLNSILEIKAYLLLSSIRFFACLDLLMFPRVVGE